LTHFFYDFTHFDGKFFSTLKYLVFKPGFVSGEYIRGKRASYLHPIRMYVFTSAIFFIIFFWIFSINRIDFTQAKANLSGPDSVAWLNARQYALGAAETHQDSMDILEAINKVKSGFPIDSVLKKKKKSNFQFSMDSITYNSIAEYDSTQASLPAKDRDNWLKKRIKKREIIIKEKYNDNANAFMKDVLNNFIHQFPKLFFISLPIFAFILKLLYIRRRSFYYADHAIFSIHLYIFSYILLLVVFGFQKLGESTVYSVWSWLIFILWLYWLYYVYRAMRNFYKQGRFKTIVKYIFLNFAAFITIIFLFAIFFTYSVLET